MKQKVYFYSTLLLLFLSMQLSAGKNERHECVDCTQFYGKVVAISAYNASIKQHTNTKRHKVAIGERVIASHCCDLCTNYYKTKNIFLSQKNFERHKETNRHRNAVNDSIVKLEKKLKMMRKKLNKLEGKASESDESDSEEG